MDVRVDFDPVPWQSPLPGVRFKAVVRGGQQLRLLEFTAGFEEPDWCTRGHAGGVIEGSLTLRFRDGSEQRLGAGDVLFIAAGEIQAHKAVLGEDEGALLLLFENVAAPQP